MLTLYDFGNSVCCQKVRIPLRAKALDWESVKVDLFKAEQIQGAWRFGCGNDPQMSRRRREVS
jgi:glutathione S-transferase